MQKNCVGEKRDVICEFKKTLRMYYFKPCLIDSVCSLKDCSSLKNVVCLPIFLCTFIVNNFCEDFAKCS